MSEEEIYKMLLTEKIDKFPLLNEIFAIRNNKFKINDYTIYVTGLISLDVINRAIEKVNLIDKLQKENKEKDRVINLLQTKNIELLDRIHYQYELLSEFEKYVDSDTKMKIYSKGEENE